MTIFENPESVLKPMFIRSIMWQGRWWQWSTRRDWIMIEIEKGRIQGERDKLSFSCSWAIDLLQARSDPKSKELSASPVSLSKTIVMKLIVMASTGLWDYTSSPQLQSVKHCGSRKKQAHKQSLTDQLRWVNLSDLHSAKHHLVFPTKFCILLSHLKRSTFITNPSMSLLLRLSKKQ